jgi:hypothetical protein
MDLKQIKSYLDSDAGQTMRDFLIEELKSLKDMDNLKEYSTASAMAIEMKSQSKAYKKLREILEKLMTISDIDIERKEKDQFYSM